MQIARLALIQKFPFYAPALWSLRLVERERVPTAAVDRGGRLYYNPQFVARLLPKQVTGLLWHELEHLLRHHLERGDTLELLDVHEQRLWNIACDCAINDDAKAARLALPPGGLYPQRFGLEPGGLDEHYYWILKQRLEPKYPQNHEDPPTQGQTEPSGQEAGGCTATGPRTPGMTHTHAPAEERQAWELPQDHSEYPALSPTDLNILRREVARAALEYHLGRGDLPLGVLRWAQAVGNPTVPWQHLLRHFVHRGVRLGAGRVRPSYERPHRRQGVYRDVILPGTYDLKPHVAVVLDTSGSVGEAMLGQALAEVDGILRWAKVEVTVLCVDAAVYTAQRVHRARQLRLQGGGGTDMRLGIEAALQLRPCPVAVVVLTDGLTPWPETPPGIPVIAGILGELPPDTPEYVWTIHIPEEF